MQQVVETHPALVRKLFVTDEVNDCGAYCLQLCKDGVWQHVVVDDLFPAYADGRYTTDVLCVKRKFSVDAHCTTPLLAIRHFHVRHVY